MWWKGTNRKGPGAGKTYEEKFWEYTKVASNKQCWEWIGPQTPEEYGKLKVQGKNIPAHRMSYEMHISSIPKNMLVCHHCDNPSCVNPSHLFLGTHQDNQADKVKKKRQARGKKHGFHINPNAVSQGERHHKAKLSKDDVIKIRKEFSTGQVTRQELAKKHNTNWSTIDRLIKRQSWKSVK